LLLCLRDIESYLCVFTLILCLRWAALCARERSRANPHAHGEAHLVKPYRPRDVSDTETILSLILNARRPRTRRGLLQQHRIIPGCLIRRVLLGGGGLFPPWSFLPIGIGETPHQRFAGVWRSYLPPQSFLPVAIGEATPVTNFAFFGFVSLHSLSYLWVSGRRPC